ncbi:hypothetical protein T492DRAFT_1060320 [Pavlovales sp. CCMP2436]|nr:hypothetical protein T492DRAFT_1060320 [Pavlovales sp. CCMP2436]
MWALALPARSADSSDDRDNVEACPHTYSRLAHASYLSYLIPCAWQASELKRKAQLQQQAVQLGLAEQAKPADRSGFYMGKQIALLDAIKTKQDKIAALEDEIRTDKVHMTRVHGLDAEESYNSKPLWETTGVSVLPYRDSSMTGLSKRTPTGGFFAS